MGADTKATGDPGVDPVDYSVEPSMVSSEVTTISPQRFQRSEQRKLFLWGLGDS